MLVATLVFLLIVIAYTGWVFRVMRAPVTAAVERGWHHLR
jgi:cytochrome bd-type quinol oxidase subunit 2